MKNIGIIGCGTMGSALAKSFAATGHTALLLNDKVEQLSTTLAQSVQGRSVSLTELLSESSVIFLAVKPQIAEELYPLLRSAQDDVLWISLMAGISLATLARELESSEIIRIMPNIGAQVGASVTAVAAHRDASADLIAEAVMLVESFGTAHLLPEKDLAAFTGISASAIAAYLSFLDGIAMGGVNAGLPYDQALAIIRETAGSANALLRACGAHPAQLITNVCSPGGTTIEMMQLLLGSGFEGLLMDAVEACVDKYESLEPYNGESK